MVVKSLGKIRMLDNNTIAWKMQKNYLTHLENLSGSSAVGQRLRALTSETDNLSMIS